MTFSPDRRILAVVNRDGTVGLWEVATGRCTAVFRHHSQVEAVAFSPDGRTVAAGSRRDKTLPPMWEVWLWDVATGRHTASLAPAPTDQMLSVAFSPDGRILASGGLSGKVWLWDVATGRHAILTGPRGAVEQVAFSPNGGAPWPQAVPAEETDRRCCCGS